MFQCVPHGDGVSLSDAPSSSVPSVSGVSGVSGMSGVPCGAEQGDLDSFLRSECEAAILSVVELAKDDVLCFK